MNYSKQSVYLSEKMEFPPKFSIAFTCDITLHNSNDANKLFKLKVNYASIIMQLLCTYFQLCDAY